MGKYCIGEWTQPVMPSQPGCIMRKESTSPALCWAESRPATPPQHPRRAPPPPAVCTHNHAFICCSVATRPVKTRLFGMPGGKCHPQKRTPLLRHLRCVQAVSSCSAAQGQALAQSSSDFPSNFLGNRRPISVRLWPVKALRLRISDKVNLRKFFSRITNSTGPPQHSRHS